MIAEIFKLDKDGNFIPTSQALNIPEFKNLWTKVENPEIYFSYIHYMLYPVSIYSELAEDEKENTIHEDYPVDKNNPYFVVAYNKAEKLYTTPLRKGYLSAKKVYETLIIAMNNIGDVGVTFGRDGNYSDLKDFLSRSEQFMEAYKAVENKYKEEISAYGSREIGYDDDFDYSSKNPEII